MYLKSIAAKNGRRFVLRETYRDRNVWTHRNLMDLGSDPSEYVVYSGPDGFGFKPELERVLHSGHAPYSHGDLTEVFLPFLRPHIRERLRGTSIVADSMRRRSKACAPDELSHYQRELHPFDVRRLHYLTFGRMDMGRLEGKSFDFLDVLSCKCREEIEVDMEELERDLPPREYASYVYTSLHLQKYFPDHRFRNQPFGLDLDEVDACLLREVCRLNEDEGFFKGDDEGPDGRLHPYLVKYVTFYFDHAFEPNVPIWEFLKDFQRRRRTAPPPVESAYGIHEACRILDVSFDDFLGMERDDLIRTYRRRAKRMHPDKGGDHRAFIRLREAYELLISKKR
ncbi:MAG: J domain-containing protein [Acidobacteriota bacterium]